MSSALSLLVLCAWFSSAHAYELFARTNLVGWCIVPFDAKKRGPEERAAMLERLGFRLFAYDYRAEHIPEFDAEMEALNRHGVRLLAWWFPGALNDEAKQILTVLARHRIREAQLWVSGGGELTKSPAEQGARVAAEAQRIAPIAEAAAKLGCQVALYNHGGWFGEPENQLAIIERLRSAGHTNVGIVYNQHHGHAHVGRFAALLALMKPHLLALNLNGMARDGDQTGKKILPLAQGELDLELLGVIRASGWQGPIGILNHTVPHPGEFGYDTWDRTEPYAANCWAGMALDEARGIAYITTGGPKPNFIGVSHLGDNLFANCVVALDARTGKYLWHFQEIRHDLWDLDISAPPNLGTITRAGKRVDVVAACTKIGNTLLLDRVTGKPIFPFRLRRAPTSTLPGERTAPYQPDVELPEPFLRMEFTEADVGGRNEEMAEWARTRFASATRGFFVPCSEGRANLFFGIDGGAEWTGACIDPDTGRLYVTANRVAWIISAFRDDEPPDDLDAPKTRGRAVYEQACLPCHGPTRLGISTCPPLRGLRHRLTDAAVKKQVREGKNAMPAQPDMPEADLNALVDYLLARDGFVKPRTTPPERPSYTVSGYPKFYDPDGFPASQPPWGTLNCLDLNTGKMVWSVPLGSDPRLQDSDLKNTGSENYGGAIVTAGGLVFCAGTRDNKLRAFDKDTGAELWSAPLPWTGNAPPASYEVNGRQYIVIAATGGNKLGTPYGDAYVAFALPRP